MVQILLVFILLCLGLDADSPASWEYSKDQIHWKEINIPINFSILNEDKKEDEYYLRHHFSIMDLDPKSPLSMRAGVILDRDRVYLNGKYLDHTGIWNSDKPQGYDKIRIYHFPDEYLDRKKTNVVLFHIKRYFPDEIGIAQDRFEIGPTTKILRDFHREETLQLLFLIVYLTVSSYFGFLYIRRRSDQEYLYFALFALNLVIYQFLRTQTKFILPLEFWEIKKLEYLALPSFIPFMAHFLRTFLNHSYRLLMKILDFMSMGIFVFILFMDDIVILDQINRWGIQPIWAIYSIQSLYYLVQGVWKRNTDSFFLLFGIVTIIGSAVFDILAARYVWNFPRISGYAFIANVVFQAFLLANRFVKLNKEVEDLNLNLEEKVTTRTEQLNTSLEKIHRLKIQQDGDYFLTSLLIRPLQYNATKNENIISESVTIQKKQFEFKDKTYQIGGDLTVTEDLNLNGEDYTLFVNSDAMGKSIQGAGGALILGVLVRSLLSRQETIQQRSKFPEKWLKDAFLDIQKAFESFDGSMFVSLIMGLIHKNTGYVYYFNAEHPSLILFRSGRGFYLDSPDDKYFLRKMGIVGNEENFRVNTLQLLERDSLVMGTDGRDDIAITDGIHNSKLMNEDENLFVKILEKSKGDLSATLENLQNEGELTDDISLLKIQYEPKNQFKKPFTKDYLEYLKKARLFVKGENYSMAIRCMEKAYHLAPEYPKISLFLGRLHYRTKNYPISLEYFQRSLQYDPDNCEAILLSSYCYKKVGLHRLAIDSAERLRIRDPENKVAIEFLEKMYTIQDENAYQIKSVAQKKAA